MNQEINTQTTKEIVYGAAPTGWRIRPLGIMEKNPPNAWCMCTILVLETNAKPIP
jgi:hypothetical protein